MEPGDPKELIIISEEDREYLQKFDVKLRDKLSNTIQVLEMPDSVYNKKPEMFEGILQKNVEYYQGRLPNLREAQEYLLAHPKLEFRALGLTLNTTIPLINDIIAAINNFFADKTQRAAIASNLRNEILPAVDNIIHVAMTNPVWHAFTRDQDLSKRK